MTNDAGLRYKFVDRIDKRVPDTRQTNLMYRRLPAAVHCLFVLSFAALSSVGCQADTQNDLRVAYDAVRVTESDGSVLIGGDDPDGYYTAYEVRPNFPLTIESTAFLESRATSGRGRIGADADAGDGDGESDDWQRTEVTRARLTIAPNAECTRIQPPTCEGSDGCAFRLRMPRDGVCIAELALTDSDDRVVSDCWGLGWTDGRGQSPEQREDLTDSMLHRRDDYCQAQ